MTKETNPEQLKACYCGSERRHVDTIIIDSDIEKEWVTCLDCGFQAHLVDWNSRPPTMGEKLQELAEDDPYVGLKLDNDELWECWGPKIGCYSLPTPEAAVDAAWKEMADNDRQKQ